jgi:hypothetical protein
MVRKPTHPYGYAAFSPTGKVAIETSKLPDEKSDQERIVGEGFARYFGVTYQQLEENDHDFKISRNGCGMIVVEQIEVVLRDFLQPMTQEEYDSGLFGEICTVSLEDDFAKAQEQRAARAGASLARPNIFAPARLGDRDTLVPTGLPFRVDPPAREQVLVNKIKKKSRRYTRPTDGCSLWLLIWSVCCEFPAFWIKGGEPCVSRSVEIARSFLKKNGSGPFDEIWFMHYLGSPVRPGRIWPPVPSGGREVHPPS